MRTRQLGVRLLVLMVLGFAASALTSDDREAAIDDGRFYSPLMCGGRALISQGNHGSFSHTRRAKYAFDLSVERGTPLVAMAAGVVIHVYDRTGPDHPCYDGGDQTCYPHANLVVLRHADGSTTAYKHLDAVHVAVGDRLARGTVLGLSGSTGYSTGPHAHIMRQEDCGEANCDSLPLSFADIEGDGIPKTNDVITSKNCP